MNRYHALAAAAVIATSALTVATPASAAPARRAPTDVFFSNAGFGLLSDQNFHRLIRFHVTETTNHKPRSFTAVINLWYWPVIGTNPKVYHKCGQDFVLSCTWSKAESDLAAPGHSKVWSWDEILCKVGQYYVKFTVGGVTSEGNRDHKTFYYPAGDGGKDPTERPTRKGSHRVASCRH